MSFLFKQLKESATEWRKTGYSCEEYPMIREILTWQLAPEFGDGTNDVPALRFLREPQFSALEIYWYLRLKLRTPHILEIYRHYYGHDKELFIRSLGISMSTDALEWVSIDDVISKVKNDPDFVAKKKLHALHEAATLTYPSYILALAMGAGKTVLIGTIVATEFAMSLRYSGENKFMKNALVFAPGTTIIESLRELGDMSYESVLPPDLCHQFVANLKIVYPGKEKDIQVQRGSSYNLIVTNTERISLRARRRRAQTDEIFARNKLEANRRLQTIASLPNLGVFSDEAHHTYGNTFDKLNRVRETINYINAEVPAIAVVNTTGTPYFKKQLLKEVVVWYGLGDGIKDNILKDLADGIHQYNISEQSDQEVFSDIVREFFSKYGNVMLPNGAKAKIAFYFKTQEHLDRSRPFIEYAMTDLGESVSQILVNTQQSGAAEIDEFKRLNSPDSQKRIILLIGKGVEGWNCPSLFACALIKEQTTSNCYVLQAATRCLRQVSGNSRSAKIFLDYRNARILDRELRDNFGTDLDTLSTGLSEKEVVVLHIMKTDLPKLEITRMVKRAVRTKVPKGRINFTKPRPQTFPAALRNIFTLDFSGRGEILMPTGETKEIFTNQHTVDCYTAAWQISSRYHLPIMPALASLKDLYPKGRIPKSHLHGLFKQAEARQANYKIVEDELSEVLALIRTQDEEGKEIFEKDEDGVPIHRIRMFKRTHTDKITKGLFVDTGHDAYEDTHDLSFHYRPYNFDSAPERALFRQVLSALKTDPSDVVAFLFMGGLTDPKKTDFHFEYLGLDNQYHRYFPDFVIVKKTKEFYIVEVKAESERGDKTVEAKKKAVERLRDVQKNKFRYQVLYVASSTPAQADFSHIMGWVRNSLAS